MQDLEHFLKEQLAGGTPIALIRHPIPQDPDRWLLFRQPHTVFSAHRLADVVPLVAEVESAVANGRWAAGFLSYEAAPAFDPALSAHGAGELPLAWWAVFDPPRVVSLALRGLESVPRLDWRPALRADRYRAAIEHIHRHIAAGDTYQVNFTFPLEARLGLPAETFFAALAAAQQGSYSAFLDLGRFAVCSASPELFFELDGEHIVSRPMKGTARRGRYPEEDERRREELFSEKNRAENLMIVDMIRSDVGRIADAGSVTVDELFAAETYPTLHQLTSTVSARTRAPLSEILRALFPCASITGAPKVRTSRIIRALEVGPRGVYTGAIGFVAPRCGAASGVQARWSVAIRTAVLDRQQGLARFGTGGGIVWDSDPESEYEECRTKASVLAARPAFSLLETLLWRPRSGYFLLERHLARLASSAVYFAIPAELEAIRDRLATEAARFEAVRHRVRLLVGRGGGVLLEATPWPCSGREICRLALDDRPIDSADPFLFHKTTQRQVYEEASRRHPRTGDVVLWNERRELTESTRANLVVKLEGEWLTPPVSCGLLAGTYRAELLARGRIREAVLPLQAFRDAEEISLINSVRGWIRAEPF